MIYFAYTFGVVAGLTAGVVLVLYGHPWFAILGFAFAFDLSIRHSK